MRLICQDNQTAEDRERIAKAALDSGFTAQAAGPSAFILFGDGDVERLAAVPGVDRIENGGTEIRLANRGARTGTTVVAAGDVAFGVGFTIIAGPCAVEDEGRLLELAHRVKAAGADMLRGGAFKPRTSPYSFRGLGVKGLELLARAREETGLPVVTEALDTRDVATVAEHADMIQIGSRNMMNHALLIEAGRSGVPVLLKRGMGSTIGEWIAAAEYLLVEGNPNVVFCERGIRTFNEELRNTLDLSAIPVIRRESHLPVIADPSHATGASEFVPAMALAAAAAGASGVMLEVHDDPDRALSDGPQAVSPAILPGLVERLRQIAVIVKANETEETP